MSETYKIPLGNSTLIVKFDRFEDEEFLGQYRAYVGKTLIEEYMRVYPGDGEIAEHVADSDYNPPMVCISDADSLIRLLYWVSASKTMTLEVEVEGTNPYWLFHDVCHATRDVQEGDKYPEIVIDGESEDGTLLAGAILANKCKIPLRDIMRALVEAEKAFRERWEYDGTSLDTFCHAIDCALGKSVSD